MLTVINNSALNKWNAIVKSFNDYDIYYLPSYTKAFEVHGDGEPLLFYFKNENFKAMNVVMKRDIADDKRFADILEKNSYFDISTPYGYGGFLIEGEVSNESLRLLDHEYSSLCKREGIISEFVRFHPVLNNGNILGNVFDITTLGKTIALQLESQEQIWSNFNPKNRNVIRKAKKSGVEIFWGRDSELFNSFIDMYNSTMDKDNAKDYYYFKDEFYKSVLNDLKYNSIIFYASYDGKIIAMSMILYSNKQMHYHLSASDREYQSLAPTNLLLFEAACWGSENGYNTLHLGGGLGSREDNLYKFKKAFNRKSDYTFAIGKKIFDKEKYKKLVEIREKEDPSKKNETSFFPYYRV